MNPRESFHPNLTLGSGATALGSVMAPTLVFMSLRRSGKKTARQSKFNSGSCA
jgi:hypothetical protein